MALPAIIAEIKKASPSQGIFQQDFEPAAIAKLYAVGGAAALSVLTDEQFFHGKLADLAEARAAVTIPVLRKDFIIDEVQVIEAAAHGADAILLIAAILDAAEMRSFRELAAQYGIGVAGGSSRRLRTGYSARFRRRNRRSEQSKPAYVSGDA